MKQNYAEVILLNETLKIIGHNIHNARLHRNYTLKKLSRLTGLNIITIDKYEMGRTHFNIKDLMKISLALEIKLEKLIKQ